MLIRTLPFVSPDAAGLPVADIPSATERAVFANNNVLRWFRASSGFGPDGWRCMKTGASLVSQRGSLPDLVELAAYNGRPALYFGGDTDQMWDGGANMMPTGGAMSIVLVGRAGPNDSAFLAGGAGPGVNPCMLVHQSMTASSGTTRWAVNNNGGSPADYAVTLLNHYYEDGPMLMIGSHDPTATLRQSLRLNRGAFSTDLNPPLSVTANAAAELHVGGVNAYGTPIAGGIAGGDIAEILILDTALHVNTALRDQIESMLQARYGLW